MKITLKHMSNKHFVRLAFGQGLFEAQTVGGEGEPAFGATFILPPDHPQVAELEAAFESVAQEKWGAKAPAVLKEMRAKDRLALHDGDSKPNYDGFEGNVFVATRSKVRPTVVNRDRSPVTAADGVVYSGCYGNPIIELWAQDNQYGKRINAQLKGFQFVADGVSFSGGGTAAQADEFEDLGDGADAGDLA